MERRSGVSTGRILVDAFAMIGVAAVLVGLHFGGGPTPEELVVPSHPLHRPLATISSAYVHESPLHLLTNVTGYLVVAFCTYVLCLSVKAERWFYLTTPTLLLCLPILANTVQYELYAVLYPDTQFLFYGFSGVVAGYIGFLFLVFLWFLRTIYSRRSVFFIGWFISLTVVASLLWIQGASSHYRYLALSGGGFALLGFLLNATIVEPVPPRTGWDPFLKQVLSILVFTGLFLLLVSSLFPTRQLHYLGSVNVIGHVVGLFVGLGLAINTMLLIDVDPARRAPHIPLFAPRRE